MADGYRDWMRQARGEEPMEVNPTTGFHPDQLTAYPLARVGPKLYRTSLEALILSDRDVLYINANEMEEYNRFGLEPDEMFDDVPVFYSVMNSKVPFRGGAEMRIKDFEEVDILNEAMEENNLDSEEFPNTVLAASESVRSPGIDLHETYDVRRKLEGEDVMIQLQPTA